MSLVKTLLKFLDRKFFNCFFVELRGYQLLKRQRLNFDNSFQRSMRINYLIKENDLAELCDKYGTDKGSNQKYNPNDTWPSHTYTDFYNDVFSKNRLDVKNVFECGIGTNNSDVKGFFKLGGKPGASLRVWKEYFPNAFVYGADIDSRCLVQEERIISHVMDQTDALSIQDYFKYVKCEEFDVMLDDGLHEFSAGRILFENAFPYLKLGGLYIIEDVVLQDLESYRDYFMDSINYVRFISLQRDKSGLKSIAHNSIIVIEKRDQNA